MHRYSGPCACFGSFTVKFFVCLFMFVHACDTWRFISHYEKGRTLKATDLTDRAEKYIEVLLIVSSYKSLSITCIWADFIKRGEIEDTLSKWVHCPEIVLRENSEEGCMISSLLLLSSQHTHLSRFLSLAAGLLYCAIPRERSHANRTCKWHPAHTTSRSHWWL